MRILAVADTVVGELYEQFDGNLTAGVDLILSCGDLPPEYLAHLRQRIGVPLLYVLGNHDIRYHTSPPTGCEDIHGRLVRVDGLRIVGLGGSRWYNGGLNQFHEHEMRQIIRRMWFMLLRGRGVDLVLTHAPPRHIHDREDPCHKGFSCFHPFMRRYRPRCLLHGHIHQLFDQDAERTSQVGSTRVINCYGYFLLDI